MRVVIFGTGNIYRKLRERVNMDIVAFIDNDPQKQGSFLDGRQIYSPQYALHSSYDKIIMTSARIKEMKTQLLDIGVAEDMIWTWRHYVSELSQGIIKFYYCRNYKIKSGKKILVLTEELDYHGGALAAVYAVQALQLKGYQVILAAPSGNQQFITEMVNEGINIVIYPSICYFNQDEMWWINQFDVVLVNVFPMLPCACEISKFKPVLWWIHEASMPYYAVYEDIREEFPQYDKLSEMRNINIAAVSDVAKKNFEVYYPQRVNHIMPYGIPDEYVPTRISDTSNKLTFAIIGGVCENKAQKIFVQAIRNMMSEERDQDEFWIIGSMTSTAYYKEVKKLAEPIPQVKFLGQLTREEMKAAYQKIDVVVCASMEDCLPINVAEGLMYGKICILTDKTGMISYITNRVNGFICEAGNVESLCNTMKWIIEHKYELRSIKENARKTYEKYFTMESFGERLERTLFNYT